MINRAQLQAAFDLAEYLQQKGIQCVIAGGCARDICFGITPKDIDIVVVGVSRETLHGIISGTSYNFAHFPFYDKTDDDRILGCWKLSGCNIDVVLYDCEYPEQAIQAFDFNLNQFSLSGIHRGIDEAVARYQGEKPWTTLVPIRRDFTIKRLEYIMEKFKQLMIYNTPPVGVHEGPVGGPHGIF